MNGVECLGPDLQRPLDEFAPTRALSRFACCKSESGKECPIVAQDLFHGLEYTEHRGKFRRSAVKKQISRELGDHQQVTRRRLDIGLRPRLGGAGLIDQADKDIDMFTLPVGRV